MLYFHWNNAKYKLQEYILESILRADYVRQVWSYTIATICKKPCSPDQSSARTMDISIGEEKGGKVYTYN